MICDQHGCQQEAEIGTSTCYYHRKLTASMLTPAPVTLRLAERSAAQKMADKSRSAKRRARAQG